MRIIETCPAFQSFVPSAPLVTAGAACVADPLHAVVGSWLGPVVQPLAVPGGPAPQLSSTVRCDDAGWRR